jgi:predicted dehydrogenase
MRIGLVGYGVGGKLFHAPYIEAAAGCQLVGVVTRSPERRRLVAADLPRVPVYDSLPALIAAGVDAVAISTPPATRRALVLEALAAGVHVIADKPFAPSAEAGRELVAAAEDAGVLLSVFHNRRWDTDITTAREVLDGRELGEIWRFDSRFDLDQAETLEPGQEGGLLRDLGSHLVDQALWLLGPVETVFASLDRVERPEGLTDAGFVLTLTHASGAHSHVSASKVNRTVSRELRIFGSGGSYVSSQTDVQTAAILAGHRPVDNPSGWGYEDENRWGVLSTAAGAVPVPSAQGAYFRLYEQFAAAVAGRGAQPVPGREAVATLEVLDAARVSAADGRSVGIGC